MCGVQNTGNVIRLTCLNTADGVRAFKPRHCLSNTFVVVGTIKGQASESSLYVEAALVNRAGVSSCRTFIDILTAAPIWSQSVACDGTGAVEASRSVETAVRANMASSGQSTFINIFTCHAINVTELVATATVTLVGAVHVCTLLTAWVCFTFIQIITIPAIGCKLEASRAAALI